MAMQYKYSQINAENEYSQCTLLTTIIVEIYSQ